MANPESNISQSKKKRSLWHHKRDSEKMTRTYDKNGRSYELPNPPQPAFIRDNEPPQSPYFDGVPPPHLYHHYEQSPPPFVSGATRLSPHVNHHHLWHGPDISSPLCFLQGMHSYGLNRHQCCCDEKPPRSPSSCTAPPIHKETPAEHKPTVRVYTKAKTDYSLTIREGQVILAPTNPSDQYQHWIRDEKFGINVKDEDGFSSFALINKATGQAMKHSIGVTYPVQLTDYNSDRLDKSLLWTQGKSSGDGYRPIRAVDNTYFHLDACEGDLGGVRDGTKIILWECNDGDNQRWSIACY